MKGYLTFINEYKEHHTKIDPKGLFEIGDRVICHGISQSNIDIENREGTIIDFYKSEDQNEILVKFDTKFSHELTDGDDHQDPERKSSYVAYDKVEHLSKVKPRIRWYKKGSWEEEE